VPTENFDRLDEGRGRSWEEGGFRGHTRGRRDIRREEACERREKKKGGDSARRDGLSPIELLSE